MPKMKQAEEDALDAQMHADLDDRDAWEVLPPLPSQEAEALRHQPRRAHFSLRVPAETFAALTRAAESRGVGFTVLAREYIEAGLAREGAPSRRVRVELEIAEDGTIAHAVALRGCLRSVTPV